MRPSLVLGLLATLLVSLLSSDAAACGMFARAPGPQPNELLRATPYLGVERSVVMWDKETKQEDFVREARFERADHGFGFVVPTPTRPEVFSVKNSPFERLIKKTPFIQEMAAGSGRGLGGAPGSGKGGEPEAVQVLAQQRIGSFTAFTLQASEAGAFDRWLKDNGFVVPDQARTWLGHYVTLKFSFVAFEYDARTASSAGMTSETVRIRFATPKPYYPYGPRARARGGVHRSPSLGPCVRHARARWVSEVFDRGRRGDAGGGRGGHD